jgi:phage N-6-adenine-methyltransferase
MKSQNTLMSSEISEWETPRWLVKHLSNLYGPFTLDAAATENNAVCQDFYTKTENALTRPWKTQNGSVWLNPPYSREVGGVG